MRIFYAADSTPNSALRSNLWRDNLYRPLVDLGHDVVEFRYDLGEVFRNLDPAHAEQQRFIEKSRPRVAAEMLRQIRRAHSERPFDFFFSYFYDACVPPEAIDEIRALGILTVNWYCNASYQIHLVSAISPRYDWCLVPEKFRLADYESLGARPLYCQMAANPAVYKPTSVPFEFDVTFVGQAYGERPEIIHRLREQGIDVRVWGDGWSRFTDAPPPLGPGAALAHAGRKARRLGTAQGWTAAAQRARRLFARSRDAPPAGPRAGRSSTAVDARPAPRLPRFAVGPALDDADMIRMYSRSRINLGLSAVGGTHETTERILQVRLRDFEVPMSGGFYMVEHMAELEEFYEIGREIVTYDGPNDLVEKIRFYLSHDEDRERIRKAGHQRALRDHTWHKRFQRAFEQMGLH